MLFRPAASYAPRSACDENGDWYGRRAVKSSRRTAHVFTRVHKPPSPPWASRGGSRKRASVCRLPSNGSASAHRLVSDIIIVVIVVSMNDVPRKPKNPLLSAAGFPYENYAENALLVPVTPATPAVLRDGELKRKHSNWPGRGSRQIPSSTTYRVVRRDYRNSR